MSSNRFIEHCWALNGLSPTQKLVLVCLAYFDNEPVTKLEVLASRTCLHVRSVQRATKALEDLGLISVIVSPGEANDYRINHAGIPMAKNQKEIGQ